MLMSLRQHQQDAGDIVRVQYPQAAQHGPQVEWRHAPPQVVPALGRNLGGGAQSGSDACRAKTYSLQPTSGCGTGHESHLDLIPVPTAGRDR